jgi:hypothetical protein
VVSPLRSVAHQRLGPMRRCQESPCGSSGHRAIAPSQDARSFPRTWVDVHTHAVGRELHASQRRRPASSGRGNWFARCRHCLSGPFRAVPGPQGSRIGSVPLLGRQGQTSVVVKAATRFRTYPSVEAAIPRIFIHPPQDGVDRTRTLLLWWGVVDTLSLRNQLSYHTDNLT